MKSLLRVMEHEVHRDEMERNNNNEWIGQESSLVSALLKHDGKSVKDDRIRDPLVCCHMHLLSLKSLSRQCKKVFPYFFFFFLRIIQVDGGQSAYEVALSCGEMILLPREFLVAL